MFDDKKQLELHETVTRQEKQLQCCLARILQLEAQIEILQIDMQMQDKIHTAVMYKQLLQLCLQQKDENATHGKRQSDLTIETRSVRRCRSI